MAPPRVHHLNCGTMCPWGRRLVNGDGSLLAPGRIVCHVLLIETGGALVLVDTGFGTDDVRNQRQVARSFKLLTRPRLEERETALSQVRELGFDPADVRHVVLTHLDIDHAGGLPDFRDADVHVFAREHATMLKPPLRERQRYRIAAVHWAHGPRWVTHELAGDRWLGFDSVRVLDEADGDVALIPLHGHTLGHVGVAVREGDGWLLHCGDAFFHHGEVETPPSCPPGLRIFQNVTQADGKLRHANVERLRELARAHAGDVQVICSHDPLQLERMQTGRT